MCRKCYPYGYLDNPDPGTVITKIITRKPEYPHLFPAPLSQSLHPSFVQKPKLRLQSLSDLVQHLTENHLKSSSLALVTKH